MKHIELLEMVESCRKPQNWRVTVPIDQISDTSVAAMIRRATSGQPILGNPNMVYDRSHGERTDKVNPLNSFGLDLDDIIAVKNQNQADINSLKDKYDRFKADSISTTTSKAQDPVTQENN